MTKDNEDKSVAYSKTMDVDQPIESKILVESLERAELENRSLSTALQKLEEESAMLRELFNNASQELNNLKKPALLVADVESVYEGKAIIKLPNGNKLFSYISKEIKELHVGETVLVDQKSLNIVERINFRDNAEVEKFIIVQKPQENWKSIG